MGARIAARRIRQMISRHNVAVGVRSRLASRSDMTTRSTIYFGCLTRGLAMSEMMSAARFSTT